MSEQQASINITDNLNDELSPMLTNRDLLNRHFKKKPSNSKKLYTINNSLFEEEEEEFELNGALKEFEVHIQKVDNNLFNMENQDMYSSTPTETDVSESEDDIPDKELEISIENVPHGIIINSNVYLTNHQWHTMTFIDIKLLKCVACQMFCDLDSCQGHMDAPFHVKNLASFKPLEKFELSITRRIRNDYHCGVCNEVFNITDDNDHYASKTHEGNLLFAINKVSDLVYDNNMQDNTNTGTDTHNSRTDTHYSRTDTHYSRTDTHSSRTDTHIPAKYALRQNNNDWYQYDAHAFNNIDSCSSNSYDYEEEYNEPIKGTSYASMAGKPKPDEIPKFLNIDLGSKSVMIRFESWHMIIKTKLNEFYCMVCKKHDHIRFKAEHCADAEHVGRLARCKVVEAFEDYLIRNVNDKLYHCGHCNNLQVIPDMTVHIESSHPKKNKNLIDDKNCPSPVTKNKDGVQKVKTIENGKKLKQSHTDDGCSGKNSGNEVLGTKYESNRAVNYEAHGNNGAYNNNIVLNTPDIHSNIVIYLFGYKLNVPLLSYNMVYMTSGGYFCRICSFLCQEEEVNKHIYSLQHIELIQRTPFILQFGSNLIRAGIRDSLHCGICNILVTVDEIYEHNMAQAHTSLLANALGLVRGLLVPKGTKQTLTAASKSPKLTPTTSSGAQKVIQAPIWIPVNRPQVPPFWSQMSQNYAQKSSSQVLQMRANLSKADEKSVYKPVLPRTTTTPGLGQIPSFIRNTTMQSHLNTQTRETNTIKKQHSQLIQPSPETKEPDLETNEPHLETNEHDLETNEPHLETNEPVLETNEPNLETNIPDLEANETNLETNKPDLETNEPHLETNEHDLETNEPHLETNEPVLETNEPNLETNIPDLEANEPNLETNKPDLETNEPYLETNKPDLETNEPYLETNEPYLETNEKHLETNEPDLGVQEVIDESFDSSEDMFDAEQYVYIKLKNIYFRITNSSCNSLVQIGDGGRYCFVCAVRLDKWELSKHVDSRGHVENIEKYQFLEKYEEHLIRQIYLMYHCSICNILIMRKNLKSHMEWPLHVSLRKSVNKDGKKLRKNELKSGVKEYNMTTQKETIFLHEKEASIKVLFDINVIKSETKSTASDPQTLKRNKIVIFKNSVLKISHENWNGVVKFKNECKCVMCQKVLSDSELDVHLSSSYHRSSLSKPFEKQYYPALIRQINDHLVHCLICNSELPNIDHIVETHTSGKKHTKKYGSVIKISSETSTYADCDEDILNI